MQLQQLKSEMILISLFLWFMVPCRAQSDTSSLNRKLVVNSAVVTLYAGSLIGMNELWYKGYEKSGFHTFNDAQEWLQMDKLGHAYTAYWLSKHSSASYQWAGLPSTKAAVTGATIGMIAVSSIEVLDGFSAKWGASGTDLLANAAGAGLYLSQDLLWAEQRIQPKYSFLKPTYPIAYQNRAHSLYGSGTVTQYFKDYNGQTIWLSANLHSFTRINWMPKWLCLSIGHSTSGVLGGFANHWCADENIDPLHCDAAQLLKAYEYARTREWLLSPDIDWTVFNTNNKYLRILFSCLSMFKAPLPALQVTSNGQWTIRWFSW